MFELVSEYAPAGDQPQAIASAIKFVNKLMLALFADNDLLFISAAA